MEFLPKLSRAHFSFHEIWQVFLKYWPKEPKHEKTIVVELLKTRTSHIRLISMEIFEEFGDKLKKSKIC